MSAEKECVGGIILTLTEIQRAKLVVALDKLQQEAQRLDAKIRHDQNMFEAIARDYGSELAGGDGTESLCRQLVEMRRKIDLVQNCLEGKFDISQKREQEIRHQELTLRQQAAELTGRAERCGRLLTDILLVREFLKG